MSSALISRSPDLRRLRDEGYTIEIRSSYLLVGDVPYVNARQEVARGTLVSDLTLAGDVTAKPGGHVVWFIGDHPCDKGGRVISAIKHQTCATNLAPGLAVQHAFSNKPPSGYPDYHAKMSRYIEIISAPAQALQPGVTAKTFKPIPAMEEESVFRYLDTASSRAGISAAGAKLGRGKVAIVGLGGTGAYILDFVAKTPIPEIHLYDGDIFLNHNAFRAPSAASFEELLEQPTKVAYHAEKQGRMRRGIVAHPVHITEDNVVELLQYDFVFLAMDAGPAKKLIIDTLQAAGKPFVDTGIGMLLNESQLALLGVVRVTTSTAQQSDHVGARVSVAENDGDDLYRKNIQVVELNALAAAFAVLKWKKLWDFYLDHEREHDTTYSTNMNLLTSEVTG